jgi:hypothetical protein
MYVLLMLLGLLMLLMLLMLPALVFLLTLKTWRQRMVLMGEATVVPLKLLPL